MLSLQDVSLSERDFKNVQSMIYRLAGISLGESKQVMVQGRLSKRMRKLNIGSYSEYIDYVKSAAGTEEVTLFINSLTTNKTDFFRESHHFDFLSKVILPEIAERASEGGPRKLRIWCSAASTGEEPYTIAMVVREFFGRSNDWDIRILASDIDTEVLSTAEKGVYLKERLDDLPSVFKNRYFDRESKVADTYRVKDNLRELIAFRQLNLHDASWPINTPFDVIFCRNVLIYFDAPSQMKIIEHFGNYLPRDRYLMLGHSESLFGLSDQFESLGETVYRKLNDAIPMGPRKPLPKVGNSSTGHSAVATAKTTALHEVSPRQVGMPSDVPRPDGTENDPKKSIIVGEIFVSDQPVWITTLLGSCVSVCLFDEVAGVAGMNHFMLAEPRDSRVVCHRYGVHSMELLINSMMARGADRGRLKAKVFGGCSVVQSAFAHIGLDNVEFAFRFLKTENIPLVAEFTNQGGGMHVEFHTRTLKARVRLLDRKTTERVEQDEKGRAAGVERTMKNSEAITLFNE